METLVMPSAPNPGAKIPRDPAKLSYPPGLAVEIALQEHLPRDICEAYGISREEWDRIKADPLFVSDVSARVIELQSEGASFKMKARLQSLEYLKEIWKMAHTTTVADNVRANLMTFVIKAAGLDGSKDQAAAAAGSAIGAALQINLHLG